MKKILFIVFCLFNFSLFGQEEPSPDYSNQPQPVMSPEEQAQVDQQRQDEQQRIQEEQAQQQELQKQQQQEAPSVDAVDND
jgi:uncharacterized protein with von Willebrand factor type A (vWA) domain